MFLALLALATSPSFAVSNGCRISEVQLDLRLYIQISASLAVLDVGPVPLGTSPSPDFDSDMPTVYTLIPSSGALTLMVTHQEARPTDSGAIDIVPISDMFTIDGDGNVWDADGQRHACSTRRAIATEALAKMQEMYHRGER